MFYRVAPIVLIALWSACPSSYGGGFANVTHYHVDKRQTKRTSQGVRYIVPTQHDTPAFRLDLDAKTNALEVCLGRKIRRDWFAVVVPPDWYVSKCSGEQLVPSVMPCQLCRAKGLVIPDECCGVAKPTLMCPCVCNMRAGIQDDYYIVTAPNLKLYAAELMRLVTSVNNVWADPVWTKCLR